MAGDGGELPEEGESPDGTTAPRSGESGGDDPVDASPGERTKPLVTSLCAGLASDDAEMAAKSGVALCLVGRRQPGKVSAIIGRLVTQVVDAPKAGALLRTLATLREDHGREIRGALITETGYTDARRIYGRIEHTSPWDIAAIEAEIPAADEEPSFLSRVMRLVEIEEQGRDPLDSDVWVRFIQRLPGEGGESASKEDIERAAARQGSRPRTVRRRDRRIRKVANSRTFRAIEAHSRFDELEVLSPLRSYRLGRAIRARGRIGVEEYALTIRLPRQLDDPAFGGALAARFREWHGLDDERIVAILDWGETPRPWAATEPVARSLASQESLSTLEAFEHAELLTGALATLHRNGVVHGGIDPSAVGYPPNTLDGVVDPILDHVGLVPVYRRFGAQSEQVDIRYSAPEFLDERYGGVDRSTDIYHLGAVLYRALTGAAPFDGDAETVREGVRSRRPPPPSERNPDLPGGIDEVIAKATAKQKLMRYETATRFHREIRRLRESAL